MTKIIIDGENCVMGRLASFAIKQALQGKEIDIVNSEKVFILGNKKAILADYIQRRQRGKSAKMKGPQYPTIPERILERAIRGMIKYKEGRGKAAFNKIRCYAGVPHGYEKMEKIAPFKLTENKRGISLKELSDLLRGK